MTIDNQRLDEARRAKGRLEALRQSFRGAEEDFHAAVRRLHQAGATAREVADGLDISEDAAKRILDLKVKSDLLRCSFCSKSQKKVRKLIAGPGVYICDACTAAAAPEPASTDPCSFCGKSATTVGGMAPGPDVRICNECLDLCNEILAQELD